jgi:hypothetical protein
MYSSGGYPVTATLWVRYTYSSIDLKPIYMLSDLSNIIFIVR